MKHHLLIILYQNEFSSVSEIQKWLAIANNLDPASFATHIILISNGNNQLLATSTIPVNGTINTYTFNKPSFYKDGKWGIKLLFSKSKPKQKDLAFPYNINLPNETKLAENLEQIIQKFNITSIISVGNNLKELCQSYKLTHHLGNFSYYTEITEDPSTYKNKIPFLYKYYSQKNKPYEEFLVKFNQYILSDSHSTLNYFTNNYQFKIKTQRTSLFFEINLI